MTEGEDTSQPGIDDDSGERAAEESEGRHVLDVVDQQRALGMWLDDVPVPPALERTAHLLILMCIS